MSEQTMFPRWKEDPEVGRILSEMERTAERHAHLAASDQPQDKVEARKIWKKLSDCYWDLLFSLLDAQTASFPEQLTFDEAERLFINFGFLDGITPVHKDFDAARILASRADADVFPPLAFSDYIAECWGAITAQPCPASGAGVAAEERIEAMEERLEALQAKRDDELLRVLKRGATTTPPEKLIEDLDQNLFSAMQVAMRVKEYREAKEEVRQTISQERFRYVEAERILSLQLSSACKDPSASGCRGVYGAAREHPNAGPEDPLCPRGSGEDGTPHAEDRRQLFPVLRFDEAARAQEHADEEAGVHGSPR